jgi:hypothetical protein
VWQTTKTTETSFSVSASGAQVCGVPINSGRNSSGADSEEETCSRVARDAHSRALLALERVGATCPRSVLSDGKITDT